ncbi:MULTISPECIES: LexA family transcriptional regulator [Glaesserella]|uniref:Transcriptional regulator n=1 Tax=Glaesserella australis TaxID=2094024 RepID=A0A328C0W2_9PAST|nr:MULTISPECIES: S24 family peptidase [Glaesserella]AUI66379.1 transcriptional regulator [Glaesserella sp. 15-184]RAL19407.1 transcriptional regulator [Glaesserella australis]
MAHLRQLTRELSYQPMPLYRDSNINRAIKLDLNSLCIRKPKETFFIHVKNPNLISWGIELDDLLIVENGSEFEVNDLLVVEKQGEYKFYQFFSEIGNEKILFSLDVSEPNLRIQHWEEVNVAGVITNVVHQMKSRTSHQRKYAA